MRRRMPNETSIPAIGQRSQLRGMTNPIAIAAPTAPATASACPTPSGNSARITAPRRRSCMPSATANSQAIPGLMPWNAPSATSIAHDVVSSLVICVSREAVGIGAGVAALQVNLVRPHPLELHEASGRELDAAVGSHVYFGQPAVEAVGIE